MTLLPLPQNLAREEEGLKPRPKTPKVPTPLSAMRASLAQEMRGAKATPPTQQKKLLERYFQNESCPSLSTEKDTREHRGISQREEDWEARQGSAWQAEVEETRQSLLAQSKSQQSHRDRKMAEAQDEIYEMRANLLADGGKAPVSPRSAGAAGLSPSSEVEARQPGSKPTQSLINNRAKADILQKLHDRPKAKAPTENPSGAWKKANARWEDLAQSPEVQRARKIMLEESKNPAKKAAREAQERAEAKESSDKNDTGLWDEAMDAWQSMAQSDEVEEARRSILAQRKRDQVDTAVEAQDAKNKAKIEAGAKAAREELERSSHNPSRSSREGEASVFDDSKDRFASSSQAAVPSVRKPRSMSIDTGIGRQQAIDNLKGETKRQEIALVQRYLAGNSNITSSSPPRSPALDSVEASHLLALEYRGSRWNDPVDEARKQIFQENQRENKKEKRREDGIVSQLLEARASIKALMLSERSEKDRVTAKGLERERRLDSLCRVYEEFDVNGDGTVSSQEMLALGQARRDLGQKGGEWTKEQNESMMRRMGQDQKGHVSMR